MIAELMRQTRERQAAEAIAHALRVDPEQVRVSARFSEDLGADEAGMSRVASGLEDRLGVEIPREDAQGFRTVEDALIYLAESTEEE